MRIKRAVVILVAALLVLKFNIPVLAEEGGGYIQAPGEDRVDVVDESLLTGDELVTGAPAPESRYLTPKLPPLRDQNPYGSCWAHAINATAEIYVLNHPGILEEPELVQTVSEDGVSVYDIDFSEAHTCYYMYNTPTDPLGGTAGDVNGFKEKGKNVFTFGGSVEYARSLFMSRVGPASEELVKYSDASKIIASGLSDEYAFNDVVHMKGVFKISPRDNPGLLKQMIKEYGAAAVSYYNSGSYYNSTNNCYYYDKSGGTNHSVTIVGWDDDFPASNFSNDPGVNGAWIIRNSWDDDEPFGWGKNKYFYLSYGDKSLSKSAFVFIYDKADDYSLCYQYDGGMATDEIKEEGVTGANIFTAKVGEAGEYIKAVSFDTEAANESFCIDIYAGLDEDCTDPTQGTKLTAAHTEGTTSAMGIYTAELENPVFIKPGDRFAVVVSLSKAGDTASLAYENNSIDDTSDPDYWEKFKTSCTVHPGESLVCVDGQWQDITDYLTARDGYLTGGNLRIKAFGDAAEVTPSDDPYEPVVDPDEPTDPKDPKDPVKPGNTIVTVISSNEIPDGACSITYDMGCDITTLGNLPTRLWYTPGKKMKAISLKKPTRTGYIFKGWRIGNPWGKKIKKITKKRSENLYLVACWTPIRYTVVYKKGTGGTAKGVKGKILSDRNIYYDKPLVLPEEGFYKEGYKLAGFTSIKGGTGVMYLPGATVQNLAVKNKKKVLLYAIWTPAEIEQQ